VFTNAAVAVTVAASVDGVCFSFL